MTVSTLLYRSEITDFADESVITNITIEARANNLRDDLTGLLVFDGHTFVQWVEGPEDKIIGLLKRLKEDVRHHDIKVIFLGEVEDSGVRRFPDWHMAVGHTTISADITVEAVAAFVLKHDDADIRKFQALLDFNHEG